jgi:hypothetical protein
MWVLFYYKQRLLARLVRTLRKESLCPDENHPFSALQLNFWSTQIHIVRLGSLFRANSMPTTIEAYIAKLCGGI